MSFVNNQRSIYQQLGNAIRPHWHRDQRLPERIQKLLARDKRFGSRDRRLYRELLYTTLRFLPWIEPLWDADPEHAAQMVAWLCADSPATRRYREELTADWPPFPESLAQAARHLNLKMEDLLPSWVQQECPAALDPIECDYLHRRAPLWLRFQTPKPEIITDELDRQGLPWQMTSALPDACQVLAEADLTQTEAYENGLFEIQDLGSQFILNTQKISTGQHWLDACAGAGGKTLQLARLLGSEGRVTAHDIRPRALSELTQRARRANLTNISTTTTPPREIYDGILIDAPCSGTGTWRRSPHLKNMTRREDIARHAALQSELLLNYAPLLHPGGLLIYATCSLARRENEDVIEDFLNRHPKFSVKPPDADMGFTPSPHGLAILPSLHDTDGFFVSCLVSS